jgi:hypothetical protein
MPGLPRPQPRRAARAAGVALALREQLEMKQNRHVVQQQRRLDATVTNMTGSVRQAWPSLFPVRI